MGLVTLLLHFSLLLAFLASLAFLVAISRTRVCFQFGASYAPRIPTRPLSTTVMTDFDFVLTRAEQQRINKHLQRSVFKDVNGKISVDNPTQ